MISFVTSFCSLFIHSTGTFFSIFAIHPSSIYSISYLYGFSDTLFKTGIKPELPAAAYFAAETPSSSSTPDKYF